MRETSGVEPDNLPVFALDELVPGVRIDVDLSPGSGLNTGGDWWGATLDVLGVGAVGYGVDAALDALAHEVRAELAARLEAPVRESEVAVLLRLWVADRRGQLRALLDASGRVEDFGAETLA